MRLAILFLCMVCAGCQTVQKSRTNPQDLQSVLGEVKKSFNMQDAKAKYCPLCGKHYNGHIDICPIDQKKLILIE